MVQIRKRESLQYTLLKLQNLDGVNNNHTHSALKTDTKAFATFCKTNKLDPISQPREVIQAYADHMVAEGRYSAGTIHRKLAAPCRALKINMGLIEKPKRTADTIQRGRRKPGEVKRGDLEAMDPKYERLVALQQAVGIRRNELRKLTGADLRQDESGYLCVYVARGKGGKEQYQRIADDKIELVKSIMGATAPSERVFTDAEMDNKINLHAMRASVAQEAYKRYADQLQNDPSLRARYISELRDRYIALHPHGAESVTKWLESIGTNPYYLRGANRKKAIASGLPVEYDRLVLMMVSVFHLSHWRLDVTTTNYMIK